VVTIELKTGIMGKPSLRLVRYATIIKNARSRVC
jgi:hypothetical protein